MIFSIIIPLFNKSNHIVDCVNSILSQEVDDLEVIVINDGSTDDGAVKLSSIEDPRLKIFHQVNFGVSVARNVGIALARGTYICFLDGDDLWSSAHLTTVQDLILIDPDAIAWATGYTEFGEFDSLPKYPDHFSAKPVESLRLNQCSFMRLWAQRPFLCTGSIAVRTCTLQKLQPCFPPGERLGEDQDLWFRLSENGYIRYIAKRGTVFYRRNVGNSLTSTAVLEPLPSFVRLLNRASNQAPSQRLAARHLFSVHVLHVAWSNCLAGKRAAALYFLGMVAPSVRWTYWFRIFVCLILPVGFVRAAVSQLRRKETNHL